MARASSRLRKAVTLLGKELAQCFVIGDGLFEVFKDYRPSPFAADVFAYRFREQA